jgi:class 3 adenylate cyclase
MRDASEAIAAHMPDWPRFRIGVHTGRAVIGNVGTGEQRSFAALGDTTNVAARVQSIAQPGHVLVSADTLIELPEAEHESLGPRALKGKTEPIEVFELVELSD